MRKLVILAVLLVFCMTLLTPIASAASWRFITSSSFATYYFDTSSVQYLTTNDGERYIQVWLHGVFYSIQEDGAKTFTEQIWYRTDRKAYALKALYRYAPNGDTISTLIQRGYWINFLPGSIGEQTYDKVKDYCEQNL